jgi:hypothetical protein
VAVLVGPGVAVRTIGVRVGLTSAAVGLGWAVAGSVGTFTTVADAAAAAVDVIGVAVGAVPQAMSTKTKANA